MKAGTFAAITASVAIAAFPCAAAVFIRSSARSAATRGAAEWPFTDIPVPAAFSPSFTINAPGDGFSVATGKVPDSPTAAAARLRAALVAGGWTPAAPTENFDGASFWTRGRFVAIASATQAAEGGGSVWLILRRKAIRS